MRIIKSFIWALLWTIIMFYLMLRTPSGGPALFEGFDKLAHCGSFYLLTTLIIYGAIIYSNRTGSKVLTIICASLISGGIGVATEVLQAQFTTSRQGDIWDLFADFVGIGMAIFCYMLFYRRKTATSI